MKTLIYDFLLGKDIDIKVSRGTFCRQFVSCETSCLLKEQVVK